MAAGLTDGSSDGAGVGALAEIGPEGIVALSAKGSAGKRLSSSGAIVSEAGNELIVDTSGVA